MTTPQFKIGDKVIFGRENGEKTIGKVVKINRKSVKVEQIEARGNHPVGTVWRVGPSLLTHAELDTTPTTTAVVDALETVLASAQEAEWTRLAPGYGLPGDAFGKTFTFRGTEYRVTGIAPSRPKYPVSAIRVRDGREFKFPVDAVKATLGGGPKRSEDAIMEDIFDTYMMLEPENITHDGERTRAQVRRARAYLNQKLARLFAEIGRQVTEDEAWAHYDRKAGITKGR